MSDRVIGKLIAMARTGPSPEPWQAEVGRCLTIFEGHKRFSWCERGDGARGPRGAERCR